MNAAQADLIVTIVKTRTEDRIGDLQDSLSVVIVDRHAKGVRVHEKDKLIGFPNVHQSAVSFDNVIVKGSGELMVCWLFIRVKLGFSTGHSEMNWSSELRIAQ